jgi:hypothetical protein
MDQEIADCDLARSAGSRKISPISPSLSSIPNIGGSNISAKKKTALDKYTILATLRFDETASRILRNLSILFDANPLSPPNQKSPATIGLHN